MEKKKKKAIIFHPPPLLVVYDGASTRVSVFYAAVYYCLAVWRALYCTLCERAMHDSSLREKSTHEMSVADSHQMLMTLILAHAL